jgi:hypothetical protein
MGGTNMNGRRFLGTIFLSLMSWVAHAEPAPVSLHDGALTIQPAPVGQILRLAVTGPAAFAPTNLVVGAGLWQLPVGVPDGRYNYELIRPALGGQSAERVAAGGFLVKDGRIVLHAEQPFRRPLTGSAQ